MGCVQFVYFVKGKFLLAFVEHIIIWNFTLVPGYVDNLHKPDHRVILLHVMENLIHVKDMSKSLPPPPPPATDQ